MGLNCKWWHQTLQPGPSPAPKLLTSAVLQCHSRRLLFRAVSTFFPRDQCKPWFLMQRRCLNKLVWLMKSTSSLHILSHCSWWKGTALHKGQIWVRRYTGYFQTLLISVARQGALTPWSPTQVFWSHICEFWRILFQFTWAFRHFLPLWYLNTAQRLKWLGRYLILSCDCSQEEVKAKS